MTIYSCVERCFEGEGCKHATGPREVGPSCALYMRPYAKWGKLLGCEGATNRVHEVKEEPKKRVGQQKQKKGGK